MSKYYSILIVDDEPDNFEVIEALLESLNCTLHYASSGEEAIASLERCDPDLILLDVMMPGIDGIETCKRIKAMPEWQSVGIVMVTALVEAEDLARCLGAGADDFVGKPVNGVELRARVQSMLRIKKQHDRIESLSRLQRQNIQNLERDLDRLSPTVGKSAHLPSSGLSPNQELDKMRMNLAANFTNEFNQPLLNILEAIGILDGNFEQMQAYEIQRTLKSLNRSAIDLNRSIQSFSFYLQLSLGEHNDDRIVTSKSFFEQLTMPRLMLLESSPKLLFEIEQSTLDIDLKNINFIVGELFDYVIKNHKTPQPINICGRKIDRLFYLSIGVQPESAKLSNSQMVELVNRSSNRKMTMGLKIVKQIVEIYGGTLSLAKIDADEIVYITLPLAANS